MENANGGVPTAATEAGVDLLSHALRLAEAGVHVFPCHRVVDGECTCGQPECKSPGKHPRNKNGSKDATTDPRQIELWWDQWGRSGRLNFGQTLTGRAVVDIDVADGKHGLENWKAFAAEHAPEEWAYDTTTYRTGRGGTQLVYRLPDGETGGKSDGYTNKLTTDVDFKTGPHAYVMVPGSKTVDVYTVVMDEGTQPLPAWIAVKAREATTKPKTVKIDGKKVQVRGTSILSELLSLPPDHPGRGNDWLTAVAGHFAKQFRTKKDVFLVLCGMANAQSTDPICEADFTKTVESVWGMEMAKSMTAGKETGYLQSAGDHIEVMTWDRENEKQGPPEQWGDFDIKVTGIVDEEESTQKRFYHVRVTIQRTGEVKERTVEAAEIADARKLTQWLASMGCTIGQPSTAMGSYHAATRLVRYLEGQGAPLSHAVNELGWQKDLGVFITHQGIIRPGSTGIEPFEGVRPSSDLRPIDAPYRYGFADGGRDEVRAVLEDLLTFHDEVPLAALVSWYAMVILMPEVRTRVSVFPFFAIEAVSGSGKTTGSVSMAQQLFGYDAAPGLLTPPMVAKRLSKTRSGAVWMDDADDPARIQEVLRMLTGGGQRVKAGGQNWDATVVDKAHGAFIMTGEGLGMSTEKALIDRMLMVGLSDPSGRKSQKPGRGHIDQWEDVVAMKNRYDGSLTALAGTVVSELLKLAPEVADMVTACKPRGAGRKGDVYGVLLAGARAIDWLMAPEGQQEAAKAGEGRLAALLGDWAREQLDGGSKSWDNALTLELLPWAIRQFGTDWTVDDDYRNCQLRHYPARVRDPQRDEPNGRYVAGEPVIYFHTASLCDAWAAYKGRGDAKLRTQTPDAIRQQAKAAGFTDKPLKLRAGPYDRNPRTQRYWIVRGEQAQELLNRAGLGDDESVTPML